MNSGVQRARPGQPGQPHHRPRACSWSSATSAAAGPAGSTGPPTATPASSASASPRTRTARRSLAGRQPGLPRRRQHGHGVRRRRAALHRRPEGSRTPEELANAFAACLRTLHHPKLVLGFDAILVVGPEHARVFAEAGWDRERLLDRAARTPAAPRQRARAGRRRHRRGRARARCATPRCPSSAPTGCCSCTPAAAPGCSLPSSAGGPTVSIGSASRSRREVTCDEHDAARPDRRAVASPSAPCSRRPASLRGQTVGLLDISKPRGDVFLDRLEERLDRRGRDGACATRSRRSPSRRRSTCATRSPPSASW